MWVSSNIVSSILREKGKIANKKQQKQNKEKKIKHIQNKKQRKHLTSQTGKKLKKG